MIRSRNILSHVAAASVALLFPFASAASSAPASPPTPAPPTAHESWPEVVKTLKSLYLAGKLDEAEQQALKHLEVAPEDVEVRVVLANCYHKRALERLQTAESASLEPGTEIPGAEWFDKTKLQLREALRLAPQRRDIWMGLCAVESEARNSDGVTSCTEEMASRFPEDPSLVVDLRDNIAPFIARAEFPSAVPPLEALARHYPRNLDTLLALGRSQYLSGKREEGIATIDKVLEFDSGEGEAQYQRAELTAYEGDFRKAGLFFARAAKLNAREGLPHLGVITSLHTFDRAAAAQMTKRLDNEWKAAVVKSFPRVHAVLAELGRVISQPSPAAKDILRLAQMLTSLNFEPGALAESQVALALDPGMAEALFLRAGIYADLMQHDRAAAALAKALELMDRQPERTFGITRDELLALLGKEQYRLGQYSEALQTYSKLSHPAEHAYEMGVTEERLGRRDEAARLLRQVVENGSDPGQVEDARRRLASPPYQNTP